MPFLNLFCLKGLFIIIFFGVFFASTKSFAESNTPAISSKNSPGFFRNIPSELASPWTTEARPWLLGGTGLTAFILIFQNQIDDPVQNAFVKNTPLKVGWSKVGDYGGRLITNIAYTAGMLSHYFLTKDSLSLRRAELITKATLYSTMTSSLLKVTVRESRPYNSATKTSFPSGHTTVAFALSSFVIAEHGFFPFGFLATTLSTLTAASRINENMHYLHDVVAGATIGTAYGLGLSYLYPLSNDSKLAPDKNTSKLDFFPIFAAETKGLFIGGHF